MLGSQWRLRMVAVSVLAALFFAGVVHSAHAERTIALSTGTVQLALPSGGSAADEFAVANNGDEPLKALVYTNDVIYGEDGLPEYVRPTGAVGEYAKSPASWLSLRLPAETKVVANTPYIELEPGQEMVLEFEMRVPVEATPGDYNAIIFFEMFDDSASAGTSSKVSGRIGARIVVRVAGDVIEDLEVAPFWVRGFVIGSDIPYKFTFTNAGNVDKRYVPSMVLLDRSEAEVARTELEESAIVYAGDARTYTGSVDAGTSLFGQYTLRSEIAYDKETAPGTFVPDVLEEDRTFWVVPLWFAILVIAFVAVPFLWLVWRTTAKGRAGRNDRTTRRGDVRSTASDSGADET